MTLERQIHVENYADQDLQEELNRVEAEFDVEMSKVFGVIFPNPQRPATEPKSTLDSDLIVTLVKKAKQVLEKHRQLLLEAGKVTEATNVDVNIQEDDIILTDLERALEVLDDSNPRKNTDSLRKVWQKIKEGALEDIVELSLMPYRKPSVVLPRGIRTPLFGVYDRSIWNQQRDFMNQETVKRIEAVDQFVNQRWLQNTEAQTQKTI